MRFDRESPNKTHATHLVWRLAATLVEGLGAAGAALGQDDT
jgi:hypothetical protein